MAAGVRIFVDETKSKGFVLVAAVIATEDLVAVRAVVSGLVLARQRRVHMKNERNRAALIVDRIAGCRVSAVIYRADTTGRSQKYARQACLRALVADAAAAGRDYIVFERDDSMLRWDQQTLIEATRAHGVRSSMRWEHLRAHDELLLCVPDVIACCWQAGGQWRTRIAGLVTEVYDV